MVAQLPSRWRVSQRVSVVRLPCGQWLSGRGYYVRQGS